MEACQPHCFLDFAIVQTISGTVNLSLALPDQQIRNFARIIEIRSHNPRGNDWHLFAIESRPEAQKAAITSTALFPLNVRETLIK